MPEGYNGAYTGQQIDEGIAKANGALPQSGGVMTGPLGLAGDPAGENEATRKAYVDNVTQAVQSNLTAHTGNTNNPHGVTAEQVGADVAGSAAAVTAALTSHTGNTNNPHSVTAEQVGARPNTWMPSAAEVGAVPTSRTINGKALSADISLSAADVGAAASSHTHAASDITSGVTNNTSTSSSITGSTNLLTMNTLRYALNRTTSVGAADTSYTTYMARGMSLRSSAATPTYNGQIAWTYE